MTIKRGLYLFIFPENIVSFNDACVIQTNPAHDTGGLRPNFGGPCFEDPGPVGGSNCVTNLNFSAAWDFYLTTKKNISF